MVHHICFSIIGLTSSEALVLESDSPGIGGTCEATDGCLPGISITGVMKGTAVHCTALLNATVLCVLYQDIP